ncbi:MAG: glycosyltransferase [Paracoccaceae bacterium]
MRFLVFIADQSLPSGGTNVAVQIVSILNEEGFEALALFGGRRCHYTGGSMFIEGVYNHRFSNPPPKGIKGKVSESLRDLKSAINATIGVGQKHNLHTNFRPDDVLVVPDYTLKWAASQCAGLAKVALVQGMEPLYMGWPSDRSSLPKDFEATITTSQACLDAAIMMGLPDPKPVRLAVAHPGLQYQAKKSRKIAYMPRKMPHLSRAVVAALSGLAELEGYEFVAIDRMRPEEVSNVLADSLVFLSFVGLEGFGLPAAEAMLAGCIVIGFVGVGGAEFFTPQTGVVVSDGDAVKMVASVRATLKEYESDPRRLDSLRNDASRYIETTYTEAAFRQSVVSAFSEIRESFQGSQRSIGATG